MLRQAKTGGPVSSEAFPSKHVNNFVGLSKFWKMPLSVREQVCLRVASEEQQHLVCAGHDKKRTHGYCLCMTWARNAVASLGAAT